jgi:hypothetical protein
MVCRIPWAASGCGFIIPRTKPNRIHPTRLSNMAEDITMVPISVLSSPKPIRMRATTGRAEMDSAVPMKSAKTSRSAPSTAPKNRGNIPAARNPRANGITMPNVLTRSALYPGEKCWPNQSQYLPVRRKKTTLIATIPSSTRATGPVCGNSSA